ncbi:hypothetical protein CSHISOI_06455 [Colletotrichum shisoi]|uniref:Uncharacterized protein n=1 Tax=Colletotrichum shisoi TaxID=2078593 RepID=A0A5Q4BR34_9PEZI|nr:hypothetical protein CSHISOI_06455 [Colletotrichum shisoi]
MGTQSLDSTEDPPGP